MVCNRCIKVVTEELVKLGFHPGNVKLGEVELIDDEISDAQYLKLDSVLENLGFERIDDRKGRLIENIKQLVIAMIHQPIEPNKRLNWSVIISEALHFDYNYLSSLFSSLEGITLEQYIIRQKIERVKELLCYDELTLSQMADQLGYSSVAHLSSQFKKVTGFSPSELKKSRLLKRISIDQIDRNH